MGIAAAFVLGLLVGWLIEWVIDWFFWRRRSAQNEVMTRSVPQVVAKPSESDARQATIMRLQRELASLRAELEKPRHVVPDELQVIKGIGPEIERRLYNAGIITFEQLGALTPEDLEKLLGATIKRLANEQSLIDQARLLAQRRK